MRSKCYHNFSDFAHINFAVLLIRKYAFVFLLLRVIIIATPGGHPAIKTTASDRSMI